LKRLQNSRIIIAPAHRANIIATNIALDAGPNNLITATDRFMSGWGKCEGGVSKCAWACRPQDWEKVYVFFKHEDEGAGPKLAGRFLELAGS